jgi:hypothetical protein
MPDLTTLVKWVHSIKSIDAEPLLQVSKFDTPEMSAELVRHFNQREETRIKFWSIGNEPYHMDHYPVDSISEYIKAHATAMKAIDPSIKIFVPDLAAYYDDVYDVLLKDNKNSVAGRDQHGQWFIDGINFHNYPNAKDYTRSDVIFYSVSKMRGMVLNLLEDIDYANKKYGRHGDDALQWGITEFNITYNNPDDLTVSGIAVPSFINGQFWVDIFCLAMEYSAFTVTPWCIQESDRPSTYFGYIGGPPDFIPHSTFYHMKLLADHFEGNYVKMSSDNPFLKVFGAQTEKLSTMILLNQDDNKTFQLDLAKINKASASDRMVYIKSEVQFPAKEAVTIKPNSTLLLQFDKEGNKTLEILYDIEMAKANRAPRTQVYDK